MAGLLAAPSKLEREPKLAVENTLTTVTKNKSVLTMAPWFSGVSVAYIIAIDGATYPSATQNLRARQIMLK